MVISYLNHMPECFLYKLLYDNLKYFVDSRINIFKTKNEHRFYITLGGNINL